MNDQKKTGPQGAANTQEAEAYGSHLLTYEEVQRHFGFDSCEDDQATWHSCWVNDESQLDRLSFLPEFIKMVGTDKRYHITFDYDPAFPRMLLRATVEDPTR